MTGFVVCIFERGRSRLWRCQQQSCWKCCNLLPTKFFLGLSWMICEVILWAALELRLTFFTNYEILRSSLVVSIYSNVKLPRGFGLYWSIWEGLKEMWKFGMGKKHETWFPLYFLSIRSMISTSNRMNAIFSSMKILYQRVLVFGNQRGWCFAIYFYIGWFVHFPGYEVLTPW